MRTLRSLEARMGRAKAQGRMPRRRDLWLLLLASGGLLLSAYLLWARAAHAPVYCPLGAGCDVVQSSRYAAVFGIPVALLGVGFYAALFALAARPMDRLHRLAAALPLAFAGLGASAVFTGVQLVSLRVTCSLCLVSTALAVGIVVALLAPRPARITWTAWGSSGSAAVLAAAFLLWGFAASAPQSAEQSYAEALARHLAASGVKLYGTYWCPHCTDQKRMFGRAAALLPYIECDQRSPIGQPGLCVAAGIRAFPTWDIGGRRYEGVIPLAELADLTGFRPPP